jgi:hypothetical protein
MTPPPLTEIHPAGIATMGLTDCMAQPIRIGGNSNQMNVIGHQAVSPYLNCVFSTPMRHQFNIGLIITIIEKSLLAPVAPLGDMVRIAGHHYSCNSRHEIDCNRLYHHDQ